MALSNTDGSAWSLSGAVDTPQEAFTAQTAFADTGLRAAGWAYSVELPPPAQVAALPVVEPYTWRAQKAANGSIAFTGFVPTEPLKRYLVSPCGHRRRRQHRAGRRRARRLCRRHGGRA